MYLPDSSVRFKDLPNFNSIFGNIGNSWTNPLPKDLFIKGVPKNILNSFTNIGNQGTGLDTLRSFTFPAKSLAKNGDLFHAYLGGFFAGNDDNKRIQLSFGGSVLINTALIDIDGLGFLIDLLIIREDATHVTSVLGAGLAQVEATSAPALTANTIGTLISYRNSDFIAVSDMDANSNILLLEAESATATNDNIVHNIAKIELTRF